METFEEVEIYWVHYSSETNNYPMGNMENNTKGNTMCVIYKYMKNLWCQGYRVMK